jgi:hypothetical protein
MKPSRSHTTKALATCAAVLGAACLAGGALAFANSDASQAPSPMGGHAGSAHPVSSRGVAFLQAGQTVRLGRAGHFTFSANCAKDGSGQNVVTFNVTADTVAGLDGNPPVPAATEVNIHTNSDALDDKQAGEFDQVASASSSTEIAVDGQEVDVFYNDGVNWPAVGGSRAHDCFAGYTGVRS